MSEGMLWFDDSKQTDFKHKIERAVLYFQQKYGYPPSRCFIHPSMLSDKKIKSNGVEIRTSLYVLPHHFWLEFQNKLIRDN